MRSAGLTILLSVLLFVSCTSSTPVKEQSSSPVIRYANLQAVYSFLLKRDPEARDLQIRLNLIESKLAKKNRGKLSKLKSKRLEEQKKVLLDKEKLIKERLLEIIQKALKKISQERRIDFILNSSDNLLYGQRTFDITEDLIRTIIKLRKRSDPVAR